MIEDISSLAILFTPKTVTDMKDEIFLSSKSLFPNKFVYQE